MTGRIRRAITAKLGFEQSRTRVRRIACVGRHVFPVVGVEHTGFELDRRDRAVVSGVNPLRTATGSTAPLACLEGRTPCVFEEDHGVARAVNGRRGGAAVVEPQEAVLVGTSLRDRRLLVTHAVCRLQVGVCHRHVVGRAVVLVLRGRNRDSARLAAERGLAEEVRRAEERRDLRRREEGVLAAVDARCDRPVGLLGLPAGVERGLVDERQDLREERLDVHHVNHAGRVVLAEVYAFTARRVTVVGGFVIGRTEGELLHVVGALALASSFTGTLDSRQEQADQRADNRDDDEQFHQRETSPLHFRNGHWRCPFGMKKKPSRLPRQQLPGSGLPQGPDRRTSLASKFYGERVWN